jgi:hypothetical protein
MPTKLLLALIPLFATSCAMTQGGLSGSGPVHVVSDTVISGFAFPESVGCDASEKVLYVSQFGGTELKPGEKDGKGFISKVGLDGRVIEQRVFGDTMNKPKGIWVEGGRLWVTDIDGVWIFDTKSKKGRKLAIPGAEFANDVTMRDGVVWVSDNRSDQLFRIEPADFLAASVEPRVTTVWAKRDVYPNGLWPAKDGSLLMAGFQAADKPKGIYWMGNDNMPKPRTQPIGRLDGLMELPDGSILATDWNTGSFFRWTVPDGVQPLAKDFKGPADFCVMGDTAYVPDLVQGQVRIVKLAR